MVVQEDLKVDERVNIKPNRYKQVIDFFKKICDIKLIPFFIVAVIASSVEFAGSMPIGMIMLAAATVINIPLIVPLIGVILSFVIFKQNVAVFVNFGISFVVYSAITAFIVINGCSKKLVATIKIGIALVISNIITYVIFKNVNYTLVQAITNILVGVAFCPVFIYGTSMLININKKIIFSKEEIISFAILISFVLAPLNKFNLWNFNVANVLIMIMIMLVAWKNDWLTGTSCGLIVGLVYTIATSQSTLLVTMFAFSGFIAGLLNRRNKFIVAIFFVIGNMLLSFAFTKDIILWNRMAELIVASSILLVIPQKVIVKIDDIFGVSNGLKKGYEYLLGTGNSIKDRLNAMSDVFDNLSHITTEVTEETVEETKCVIKKYLDDYKKNECLSCKNRCYCLKEEIDVVSSHIAKRLEDNKPITKEMLPIECDLKDELIKNIQDIYSNIKLMRVVKEKEKENNIKLAEEYKTISGLIKKMVKEDKIEKKVTAEQKQIREELKYMGYVVYEDSFENTESNSFYEFITDILIDIDKAKKEIEQIVSDVFGQKMSIKLVFNSSKTEKSRIKLVPTSKYIVKAIVKQVRKADSSVSGDSYIVTELKDNSKIIAISDGMGSGTKSKEISEKVISMIEKMSSGGFNKNEIIDIVNKLVKLKENGEVSATLDVCAINEKENMLEFIKLGSAPSYILSGSEVKEIKQDTMPVGLVNELNYSAIKMSFKRSDFVILLSDGAMADVNNQMLEEISKSIDENTTEKELMNKIMEKVVGVQNKIMLDDVTVIVCKIV